MADPPITRYSRSLPPADPDSTPFYLDREFLKLERTTTETVTALLGLMVSSSTLGGLASTSLMCSTNLLAAAPGDIRLGSTLQYSNANGTVLSGSPPGEWRCMGPMAAGSPSAATVTQCVRIS